MMEVKRAFLAGTLAFLLLGAASCSVKEIRDECPVYVTVLTDQFIQKGQNEGVLSFHGTELINRPAVNFLSIIGKGYVQPMPRDYARVAVISGVENEVFNESLMTVPYGKQAGLIWAYGETFAVNQDEYIVDAVPHKQYCLVKFMFDESPFAPADYRWRFRMKAEYNGLNVYTMEPIKGDYCCTVGPNSLGEWYGVLPRQVENNMVLEIFTPDEGSVSDGKTEYVVDLGKKFAEQGYDWSGEDLKDIQVKVGFTNAEIFITVEEWIHDDTYRDIHI